MPSQTTLPAVTTHPLSAAQAGRILRKHAILVLACVLAVTVAAVFWTLGQTKIYRAESLLRLDPSPPRPLGQKVELVSDSGSAGWWNRREFYESEFRVMRSMRVALAVVRTMGLEADPGFLGVPAAARKNFARVSAEDAARILVSRLSVEGVRDSSLAHIRYEDSDPKRARAVLNTVVRIYLAQNLEQSSTISTSALDWLNGQLDHLKVDLEQSEVALNDFRQKNNVLSLSLEDRHNIISAQLEQLAKELTSLAIKRSELASQNAELEKLKIDEPLRADATKLLQSVVLSTLRTQYADQSRSYAEATATLGDNHPKVLEAKARLETTARNILLEIANIRGAAGRDLRAVDKQIGELRKRDEELQKQAHELQGFEITYNRLNRAKVNNEKIYAMVLERTRETDLTRMMNFNNIRVVDEALEPRVPVRPNVPMNVALGAALGLLLGVGLAVLRDFTDRSIKTPSDVEAFGVSCLGLIPVIDEVGKLRRDSAAARAELGKRDLHVAADPLGAVAEAVRMVRTNLTFMSPDRPYRLLLVTSALPEEGKTTVACSLATVLAQNGHRVLIVDSDLRRPRLHRTFRVPNDVGLSLAITGNVPLEECIHETDIDNVYVLPSGPIPPNPSELLQSERFRDLLRELSSKFDRVIFDSPPILPVTDAAVISQAVDGTVIVARAFRTNRIAVRQAVKQLLDVNGGIVGLVLNDVDFAKGEYGRYSEYYYQYKYGYYHERDKDAA